VAPSLHEIDAELAQYGDLLDMSDDVTTLTDENSMSTAAALPVADLSEGFAADMSPFDMVESVKRLNELLPSESEELDNQFALRPTAASLGLKDAIRECLGNDPGELGYCHFLTFTFIFGYELGVYAHACRHPSNCQGS